jgi:hypothetical protein
MRWRVGIVGVVLLVAGLLVGGRAWVRGQDYVVMGSTSRVPADARIVPADAPAPDEPVEVAIVPYRDGARSVYGLSLRNDGPLAVEVTEVARPESPDEAHTLFRTTEVRIGEDDAAGTEARLPFRPFTLEPGHERYVEVIGVIGDCEFYEPGSSNVLDRERVRYEVLGQSLEADVPLSTAIEWRYGRAARCPRES